VSEERANAAQQLVVLDNVVAAGLGLARFVMSRDFWGVLPGGMPYVVFSLNGFEEEANAGGV